ncbi:AMP-binding protein [Ferrimonas kyonanensis]|uniref:AMP-binding protein n=1 Tax=Ferrimonas kyonanensis TaxID=364763 RepID=UPI0004212271|nr:AMP-binding protein [Ferrimonas kyonanensis]
MTLSLTARLFADDSVVCRGAEDGQILLSDVRRQVARVQASLGTEPPASVLLFSDNAQTFLIRLLALLGLGVEVILPANGQASTLQRLEDHHQLQMDDHWQAADCDFEEVVWRPGGRLRLFTSGSSGEAKAVDKSLSQLEAEINELEQQFGEALARSTMVASVSHQHIYGLLFRLLWPFCAGRPFVIETLLYPETLTAALAHHAPAALVASPSLLQHWQLQEGVAPVMAFSSGGPLRRDAALERCRHWQQGVVEIYGSTETGGIAHRRASEQHPDPLWQPFDCVQVKSEQQRLWIRSPYLDGDRWYRTDDRVSLSADGMQLLGRADRTVKIAEKRVCLVSMEKELERHPWVAQVALVLLPSARAQIGAVVQLTEAGLVARANLGGRQLALCWKDHLLGHFERVTLPRRWRYPERLPFNHQGKLTRAALLELFHDDQD